MICGSEEIKKVIENHLGIHEGQTTPDGLFTLREIECMGCCANAPMVQVQPSYIQNKDIHRAYSYLVSYGRLMMITMNALHRRQ